MRTMVDETNSMLVSNDRKRKLSENLTNNEAQLNPNVLTNAAVGNAETGSDEESNVVAGQDLLTATHQVGQTLAYLLEQIETNGQN